jgi:hypothetical protein
MNEVIDMTYNEFSIDMFVKNPHILIIENNSSCENLIIKSILNYKNIGGEIICPNEKKCHFTIILHKIII